MKEKITLADLQRIIKEGVENAVPSPVWITAEISEITQNPNGHCYLDLVDYKENQNGVTAKARGMIWSSVNRILKPFFETTAGSPLRAGMHVLLKVQVQYSAIYGLSLSVLDIDPSFTVGELELQRQKTIGRLKKEGMFGMNASLPLPAVPKRLAVISSATAAGYRDFMKHLHENEYGFRFYTELFQAPMQGEEAPAGIIAALEEVAERVKKGSGGFDAVVIIRGGGAALDLSCFDDYELAVNIAQFPLPVLTGIGHDHDYHVCDMVAHTWLKTPTAVADFILDIFVQEDGYLVSLFHRISLSLSLRLEERKNGLDRLAERLRSGLRESVRRQEARLDLIGYKISSLSPEKILNKGFGLLVIDGKKAESVQDIKEGGRAELVLKDGKVSFVIGGPVAVQIAPGAEKG